MSVTATVLKPVSQITIAPDSVVTIPNISWLEFELILAELGEKRSARIAYSKETLEIMVLLPEHEVPRDLISDIVKTLLKSAGRRYLPFGSTTFKREGAAGIEPDACFYILNDRRTIGRRRLQPNDPPPDLSIETDVTSKTTIDAYLAIGVPEVWVYEIGRFRIYLLQDCEYVASDISPNFPGITRVRSYPVGNCPINSCYSGTCLPSGKLSSIRRI